MKILLVEDDHLLGDGICTGLTQAGFAVDWAKDGREAYVFLIAGAKERAPAAARSLISVLGKDAVQPLE